MGKIPKRKETFRLGSIVFVIEDADIKSIKEVMVLFPLELDNIKSTEDIGARIS
jgi:hypothetical protein